MRLHKQTTLFSNEHESCFISSDSEGHLLFMLINALTNVI